jgi:hypothetical protein
MLPADQHYPTSLLSLLSTARPFAPLLLRHNNSCIYRCIAPQDKHHTASDEKRAEAEKKFLEIQRAFDRLMATDEETTIESIKSSWAWAVHAEVPDSGLAERTLASGPLWVG